MTEIRYVRSEDKEFWYRLDKHLSEQEFEHKVSSNSRSQENDTLLII